MFKCEKCGKDIIRSGRQKFCGSQRDKDSCSYLAMRERMLILSRQRKRKSNLGVKMSYREWWIKNILSNTQRAEYERYLKQEPSYENLPVKVIRI